MNRAVALLAALALAAPARADEPAVKEFAYKPLKAGDLKIITHYPPGWKESDKRPAIVFFFGGGWTNGTPKQFEPQAKYLATRGMVALRADYRIKSKDDSVTPAECVEDAKSAIRWTRQNCKTLGIDPDRIVAAGGSAGGHIAACTALCPGLDAEKEDRAVSSKPNALVLFNPVLRFDGVPQLSQRVKGDEKMAKLISPVLHLEKSSPPCILFFGTDDQLTAQGKEFIEKANKLGHRTEMALTEGVGHGFFNRAPHQQQTLVKADVFLASLGYLEGKPTVKVP